MVDSLVYALASALVALLQNLPLPMVARLGRWGGSAAYYLDRRHRRVALANLERCFGNEKSAREITALARENFRRIGENFAAAVKTAGMDWEKLKYHVHFVDNEKLRIKNPRESRIVAIGHFGNFEVYARFTELLRPARTATTYRGFRPPSLNRLLQRLREKSGCLFFERRSEAAALRHALAEGGLILGLLADQHAGDKGLRLPFLGHECSTSAAPALLALRYKYPLHTGICYRVNLAQWRIEAGDEIPTFVNGVARPVAEITREINAAFEVAVRRDPANWFWVHNRWKAPARGRTQSEMAGADQD